MKTTLLPLLTATTLALSSVVSAHAGSAATTNRDWWPQQLDLQPLRQHAAESNPMGDDFNYAQEFSKLDLEAVKKDIRAVLTPHRTGGRPITAITVR